MPTYEYECLRCKKNFDAFQSMKDNAYATCPQDKCQMKTWGKGKVKRLLGAGAGLIFKGSGFYITDYRSEGYKSAAKSDASAAAPAAPASTPESKNKAESNSKSKAKSEGGSSDSSKNSKSKSSPSKKD
jgi:putative FmdB family regulatory protein